MEKNITIKRQKQNTKASQSQSNITIHSSQTKNPLIKCFFFPFKTSNYINCDFQIGEHIQCFFLSLRYHKTYPSYISTKLSSLSSQSSYKYLLCYYDIDPESLKENDTILQSKEFQLCVNMHNRGSFCDNIFEFDVNKDNECYIEIEKMLIDINMICINFGFNLIMCFSNNDAAQYIYSLSVMNLDSKRNKVYSLSNEEVVNGLCAIDGINKTDGNNLLTYFKDIKSICGANDNLMSLVPKMNKEKIKKIKDFFNYEFEEKMDIEEENN